MYPLLEVWVLMGLQTWIILSACRLHTFKNASWYSVFKGFVLCIAFWPLATWVVGWAINREENNGIQKQVRKNGSKKREV